MREISAGIFDLPGLLTKERTEESTSTMPTDDGDHERFSHYVRKEKIVESAVTGKPVRALCGKKWVPGRDPATARRCPG